MALTIRPLSQGSLDTANLASQLFERSQKDDKGELLEIFNKDLENTCAYVVYSHVKARKNIDIRI